MTSVALIDRVFGDWNDAGIRWCLLRGEEHLASLEGDLDMLIERDGAASARKILVAHGFVAFPRRHRQDPTPFVALLPDGDRWARLDIAHDIRVGGIHFPVAPDLIARRTNVNRIELLHPHDRFWALLLHAAWDHGHLDERHRRRLRDLAPHAGGSGPVTDQLVEWHVSEAQLDELRQWVTTERWRDLSAQLAAIRRRGLGGQRPLAPAARIARRLSSVISLGCLGLTRPGMSVALLGPDGSGKSSLTRELCRSLPAPTRRMYVGLYQRRHRRIPVPGVGFVLRLTRLAGIGLAAAYHQARGRVVVFDRHPVELAIGMSRRAGAISRLRRWLLSRMFPMADVTFVLDAPADLLSSRKPEHTREDTRRQRERYILLARSRAWPVISTADSTEAARRRLVVVVWPRLAARARRRA